uniref:DNA-directed RNA polymerase n=1 Tax=Neogobius melanostomus TaxID=47308 RepID=A0A8C6TGK2_9GOBI
MEDSAKWTDCPTAPSLRNLTDGGFGALAETQLPAVQELTRAHIESFDQAVTDGLSRLVQSIPPLEFSFRNDRVSLAFAEAAIFPPAVAKGSVCKEMRVFPAECRGRRCSYRGKLVVREIHGYTRKLSHHLYIYIAG